MMKKIIRTVSLMLCFCLLTNVIIIGAAIKAEANIATADFSTEQAVVSNLKANRAEGNGTLVAKRGESQGWTLDPAQGAGAQKLYVDLDKDFAKDITDGTEFEITVEYFDEYRTWFSIEYDSESGTKYDNKMTFVRNSGAWKKVTYVLKDAYFGDRMKDSSGKNADFCITSYWPERNDTHGGSQNAIVIKSILVRKIPGKNPLKSEISTEEVGNIFTNMTENKFKVNLTNRLQTSGTYDVTYYLKHENGEIVWSKTENLSFAPSETMSREIIAEFDDFGLYDFFVRIKNETTDSEYSTVCSYALQSEDGKRNDHYQMNVHFTSGHYIATIDEVMELLEKLNSGGIRDALFVWDWIYKPGGEFGWQHASEEVVSKLKEDDYDGDGIHESMLILGYGNSAVTGGDLWKVPTTEAQFDEWEKYVRYVCEVSGFKKFEIWNEPNLKEHMEKPEAYVELIRRTVKVVHEYNPEFKVGIGSIAAPHEEIRGFGFFDKLVENGLFDIDFDAITLHPYTKVPEERLETLERYDEICREHGRDDMEYWHTEYSYTMGYGGGVSDRDNMNIITRQYLQLNVRGYGQEWCKYQLEDGTPSNKYDDEHVWGVVYGSNGATNDVGVALAAKHGFIVTAALNYLMRDAEPIGPVDLGDDEIETAHYSKGTENQQLLALWSTGENKMVTVDLGCDKATVYDIWGNSTEVKGENGKFSVMVTEQVKYIVGDFTKIEKCENLYFVNNSKIEGVSGDMVAFEIQGVNTAGSELEVDLPGNVKLINTPVFENGKAVMKILFPDELFEETTLKINIKKNGETAQVIHIYITCNDNVAEMEVLKQVKNPETPKQWTGIIRVTNKSKSNTISGSIGFMSPSEFAAVVPAKTGPIGPGDTAEIKLDFPLLKRLGMYTLGTVFTLDNGMTVEKSEKMDFTVAGYAKTKPVIDGKIDSGEWNEDTAMYSDDITQVIMTDWNGANDLSAKSIVEWDEENLYLSVRALDDVFYFDEAEKNPQYIWRNDSVQFGILYGTVNEVVIGNANRTFEELGMGMTPDGAVSYRWSSQSTHQTGKVENCNVAVGRHNGYTHYELKIPWREIIPNDDPLPQAGEKLGFSMLVNDNDGEGRKGWIEYASGIGSTKDTTQFTNIMLIK